MPVYTYRCAACGTFETYQKMSDDSLTECPSCSQPITKVFSAPGVIGMPNGPKDPTPKYNPQRSAIWNSAQGE